GRGVRGVSSYILRRSTGMQATSFYQRLVKIAAQPPYDRYGLLAQWHTEVTIRYLHLVRTLTAAEAQAISSDGRRTVAQIVGHIAGWERFTILAVGEMAVGLKWPRIMSLSGYLEADGRELNFASVAEFNAYQAARHAAWPWSQIQDLAVQTATALLAMFTQPAIISPDFLEQTTRYEWSLPTGLKLTVPVGWYLWMVSVEHQAVDHAADLGWQESL
ncbi:MAG: DinB family protein, partial [Chloroflexota bacterium]